MSNNKQSRKNKGKKIQCGYSGINVNQMSSSYTTHQNSYTPPVVQNSRSTEPADLELGETEFKMLDSFEDLKLKENLLRGIYAYGFEVPSKIQSYAIPNMMTRKDIIAQSQSGTGKTGAFTIGILNIIDETQKYPQALVMCNTHELSIQIQSVISELGKYMNVNVALLIGGVPIQKNLDDVKTCQVCVGTPGRIRDLMERQAFDREKLRIVIVDEADELLRDEFLEQSKFIISKLADGTQLCIYSATFPVEVLELTNDFLFDPIKILVKREKLSLDLITQYYVNVMQEQNKFSTLEDLYGKLSISQCIIYVNSISKAERLKSQLIEQMHVAEVIHSKLDNKSRLDIMARFRKGEFRVLISTDLICRGIDIQHINYVINYDLPYNIESYLHRIGRSGRFGKRGVAINFVTQRDFHVLKSIERHYAIRMDSLPNPDVINSVM